MDSKFWIEPIRRAFVFGLWALKRLTSLIHTSFLPSNWNLDKIFALTGELGQVYLAKKIFPIFLHAGRWLFL